VPLFIALSIALAATILSANVKEEIVRVAAIAVATLCVLVGLLVAPLVLKVLVALAPLTLSKWQ